MESIKSLQRQPWNEHVQGCPPLRRHKFIKSTPLEWWAAPTPWWCCFSCNLCFLCGFWLVTRQSYSSYIHFRGATKWATQACTISGMYRQTTDGWTDGRTDGPKDRRTDGRTDQRTEGPKDRRTEGPKDRRTEGQKDRRTEGQKDRRTEGPKDRRMNLFWVELGNLQFLQVNNLPITEVLHFPSHSLNFTHHCSVPVRSWIKTYGIHQKSRFVGYVSALSAWICSRLGMDVLIVTPPSADKNTIVTVFSLD
jgi:hypothetical protein